MPVTPTRPSKHQSRPSQDDGTSREYSFTSPSRSRSALGMASKFTTVDNLLLPGVIGATVEGPKTPIRSPTTRRTTSFMSNSSRKNSNGNLDLLYVSPRTSREGIIDAQSQTSLQSVPPYRYVDAEVDIVHGNHSNKLHPTNSNNVFGKQYRKTFRPHDTPIAHSKRSSRYNNNHSIPNGKESDGPFYYSNEGEYVSDVSQSEDDKENHPTRMPLTPQRSRTRSYYPDVHDQEFNTKAEERRRSINGYDNTLGRSSPYNSKVFTDGNGYVDDAVDVGGYEDELYSVEQLRASSHPDFGSADESDIDPEEQIREVAELKREQDQLGFIKRVANLLRKQRDEYGWGTPRRNGRHVDDSESDSERLQTSARVRKESFKRRSTNHNPATNHLSATSAIPRTESPPVGRRTITPPLVPRTASPSIIRRTTTPPAVRRTITPPVAQRTASPPATVPSYNPRKPETFTVPSMKQLDSGIGMSGSQESQEDEYEEADEEPVDWKPMLATNVNTESPRSIQDDDPYFVRKLELEQAEYASAESDAEHPASYGISSRRKWTNRVYRSERDRPYRQHVRVANNRVYPWHVIGRMFQQGTGQIRDLLIGALETLQFIVLLVISWAHSLLMWPWQQRHTVWSVGESWVRTGVSMGLLSPGTLVGVAFLCIAIWGSHSFGSSDPTRQNCETGIVCQNGTTLPIANQGKVGEGVISEAWNRLKESSPFDTNTELRSWTSWIPSFPAVSNWIPAKNKKDDSTHKIVVPSDDIHSYEELETAVKWIQKTLVKLGDADEQLSKEFNTKMDGMSIRISGVDHKLNLVSDEVASLKQYIEGGQWIDQTVLELIRDEIPKHLVVSRDAKSGKLLIPGEFWNTARGLFMTPEQVQKSINDELSKLGLEKEPSSGGWSWGGSSKSDSKSGKIVTWEDFLRENERAMSEFVDGRMSRVTKSEFLNLVRTEAITIWQGLEKNVVSLLEKQGKLQGKNAPRKTIYGSPASDGNNDRALTDVERELISGLIDEALEKYSADAIAKADYALYSAGGRIIPRLTSADYHHPVEPTFWGRIGLRYIVPLPRREKPAEKAIEPSLYSGECWAMDGQTGQLAIRLARKIVITEITIEHADSSVVLDMDSAAKEVEIWSLRGSEDAAPASDRPAHQSSTQGNSVKESKTDENRDIPWPGAIFLTTVEYIAKDKDDEHNKPKSRQTYSIPLSKQISPSVGVVLRIKSNWGHPKYTCLYRVRVHGYEPSS
ncbi:hypothetical protein BGZ76_009167 [Entomortierella beljakovae]|nr:hypothetical protein BGZ76_009167 [Entomortierella beljakovae]